MDTFRIHSEDSTAKLAEVSKEVSKDDSKVLVPHPMEESVPFTEETHTRKKSRSGVRKEPRIPFSICDFDQTRKWTCHLGS